MEDKQQTLMQGYDSPQLWHSVPKPSSLTSMSKHLWTSFGLSFELSSISSCQGSVSTPNFIQ